MMFTFQTGVPAFQREGGLPAVRGGNDMARTSRNLAVSVIVAVGLAGVARTACARQTDPSEVTPQVQNRASDVLDWNQIFIDTLIATNTANSSSQRLGAIVHTAIFDAYNGIERRYTPMFVHDSAPAGASRRAAVIAAAYTALVGLFGSQQRLDDSYKTSLATLSGRCEDHRKSRGQGRSCTQRIERGVAWGIEVAQAVLAWRATDGFTGSYAAFNGGTVIGQWRPTPRLVPPPPTCGSMSAQGLAFTSMFVLVSETQFQPGPPRGLTTSTYRMISTR